MSGWCQLLTKNNTAAFDMMDADWLMMIDYTFVVGFISGKVLAWTDAMLTQVMVMQSFDQTKIAQMCN